MIEPLDGRLGRRTLSVAALVREVADALAQRFTVCTVRGELSGLSRAASGHWYFNLKDADGEVALVRCAMFRRAASLASFVPADGQLVELRGRLGVYEARGELQLVVESMQRAGAGALFEQFLRSRLRLEVEGLFHPDRKRALPRYPRRIGLVTSLGGAVLHDVATTLSRRAPHVPIVVYPSLVQGPGAPAALRAALAEAGRRQEVDVIVLCRGGGSLEDLWAFNDEGVVRAIAASLIPVVSAVGHETDVTLADFAADLRAPTPTAAAELVAPTATSCLDALDALQERMQRDLRRRLDTAAQRLDRISARLMRPAQRVGQQTLQLDHLAHRLDAALQRAAAARRARFDLLARRLVLDLPRVAAARRLRLDRTAESLARALDAQHRRQAERLAHLDARLANLDPHHVLARGYAWLADDSDRPVMSVRQIAPGDRLQAVFADGKAAVGVLQIDETPHR